MAATTIAMSSSTSVRPDSEASRLTGERLDTEVPRVEAICIGDPVPMPALQVAPRGQLDTRLDVSHVAAPVGGVGEDGVRRYVGGVQHTVDDQVTGRST